MPDYGWGETKIHDGFCACIWECQDCSGSVRFPARHGTIVYAVSMIMAAFRDTQHAGLNRKNQLVLYFGAPVVVTAVDALVAIFGVEIRRPTLHCLAERFPLCIPHVDVFLGNRIVILRLDYKGCFGRQFNRTGASVVYTCSKGILLHRATYIAAVIVLAGDKELDLAALLICNRCPHAFAGQIVRVAKPPVPFRIATTEIIIVETMATRSGDTDGRPRTIGKTRALVRHRKAHVVTLADDQGVAGSTSAAKAVASLA